MVPKKLLFKLRVSRDILIAYIFALTVSTIRFYPNSITCQAVNQRKMPRGIWLHLPYRIGVGIDAKMLLLIMWIRRQLPTLVRLIPRLRITQLQDPL
jgi:hypothetical protein